MKEKKSNAAAARFFPDRRKALFPNHQAGCDQFEEKMLAYMDQGKLSEEQARIVMEHVVRLGERERNPANTGNLMDLFTYTLDDTGDPIRAFAQMLADSVKVVPMPQGMKLLPPMLDIHEDRDTKGKLFKTVDDLPLNAPQRMLAAHTNVAYADPEMRKSAEDFIDATIGKLSKKKKEEAFYQMVAQSQHMPSSSFVLAAAFGLHFQVEEIYKKAGFSKAQLEAAKGFYEVSARFQPKWLGMFLNPGPRDDPEYLAWLDEYHQYRTGLPEYLKYQLSSDTLTNFLPGTMFFGKWVDAVVQFSNVKTVDEVPAALAKVVNQYLAEFEDLHREPADVFVGVVTPTLKDFGVRFDKKKKEFVGSSKQLKKKELVTQQLENAWHKKIAGGVLKESTLFKRLGDGLSEKLLDCFERIVFKAEDVILKKGQKGRGLFVIVEGCVYVEFENGNGQEQVALDTGDVFGEISLLSEGVTTAQVTAAKDTVALLLSPERFTKIVNTYHDMKDFLVTLAEERLAELQDEKPREWRIIDPAKADADCGC